MTVLLAWMDGAGTRLIADSAVTHTGALTEQFSCFGEYQRHETGVAVEEGAMKILRISSGILVGVSGDVRHAIGWLEMVMRDLATHGDERLITIVDELIPVARELESFRLVFLHSVSGTNRITAVDSKRGHRTFDDVRDNELLILGFEGQPGLQRRIVAGLNAIRSRVPLEPDAIQMLCLAFMQALGVSDYLPQHHVGGAFFAAANNLHQPRWQDDVIYVISAPDTLVPHRSAEGKVVKGDELFFARCGIRDGVGIVKSSGSNQKVFPPRLNSAGIAWRDAYAKFPTPTRCIAPVRYVAFLNRQHRRLVFVDLGVVTDRCPMLELRNDGELEGIGVHDHIAGIIEAPTPPGRFEVHCYETAPGGRGHWGPLSFDEFPTNEFTRR